MSIENPIEKAPATYALTRFIILRLLGFVYLAAFVSLAVQVLPLIGSNGLLPAEDFLAQAREGLHSNGNGFLTLPTIFWLGISDQLLVDLSWIGVALSAIVVLGYANAILMAILWFLYMSFLNIGQDWYSYGWEIQLLETGFLAIFLCPWLDPRPFPKKPASVVVIWLFRWLAFRIYLGAGLIKLRGDSCWRDLTCLYYHYETQPIPNPLSRTLHFMPHWFNKLGVLWNHVTELVAPWFAFFPRTARHLAGVCLVGFQVFLIFSGNLSFLNYLTIVPALACFDDSLLSRALPRPFVRWARESVEQRRETTAQRVVPIALAIVVAILSIAPTLNLFSGTQVMNGSFDRLHLVNTYGAFGSVGRERDEIIFEGTEDDLPGPKSEWRAYEFPFKPGDPMRMPGLCAPYQPRLDWAIWFAAMGTPQEYPWTLHIVWNLLHNDPGTLSLLANNPFPNAPPKTIRARLYHYQFAPPGNPTGAWWNRTFVGDWLPPLRITSSIWRQTRKVLGWPKVLDPREDRDL